MSEKTADVDLQKEVDELTSDYLIFKASEAVLADLRRAVYQGARLLRRSTIRILDVTYGYLSIYINLHGHLPLNLGLRFRRRLLDFVTVFWRWKSLSQDPLHNGLQIGSHRDEGEPEGPGDFPPTHQSFALLHTLPSFMALSAAGLALQEDDNQITETWMTLAADYMLQAVIEQLLVYGDKDPWTVNKTFDWGFDPESAADESSDLFIINAMFFDNELEDTNSRWLQIRREYMNLLRPHQTASLSHQAKILLETDYSTASFEERLLAFLENLHNSLTRPFLSDVEAGAVVLTL